jgi:dihydroneopterin triphosphate diphosphatase
MPRAPFQVLVYPYRLRADRAPEYALLNRSDAGWWQGVAGGGQGSETPLQAARRETYQEAGIPPDAPFLELDTIEFVPVTHFRDSHLWGEDVFVIPQYCYGVFAPDGSITLSHEHSDYRWLPYEEAYRLLKYDGNRTALWELNQRLLGRGPRG